MIAEGKEVILKVKGNSMLPFIRHDFDSVLLTKPGDLKVGDIILAYTTAEKYVLHRIWDIRGEQITLMGDGNLRGTEHCERSQVAGLVKAIVLGDTGERVDPYSPSMVRKARMWRKLLPYRVYLLKVYRLNHGLDGGWGGFLKRKFLRSFCFGTLSR